MLTNRSNVLASLSVAVLLILPIFYYTVALAFERQHDDETLLKRLSFISGSVQRLIKLPDHPANLAADIDEAFASAERLYPLLRLPDQAERPLSLDYFELKSCWEQTKKELDASPAVLKKQGELCWLTASKTIFDLHTLMEAKQKAMMENLFMLAVFGALLMLFLLYQIYRYVHSDLEAHQLIDVRTGFFNTRAFLDECVRNCTAATRNGTPFAVILIRCPDKHTPHTLVALLKQCCRREERLFKLAPGDYALMTVSMRTDDFSALVERIGRDLAPLRDTFAYTLEVYAPGTDTEAFGPACLRRLEGLNPPAQKP